jgi:hypothetical protein
MCDVRCLIAEGGGLMGEGRGVKKWRKMSFGRGVKRKRILP